MISTHGRCMQVKAAYSLLAAFDVVVDLFILILPFPTLWRLQMPKTTIVALTVVFSMGILTMAFGVLRPISIISVGLDVTHSGVMGHLWTVVENGVAIVVSSSPFLRPILEQFEGTCAWLTSVTRTKCSGKHNTGPTEDERHLVTAIPAAFQGQGSHDGDSVELSNRQTVWPSSSSFTV
ncbi:hypothetical protein BDV26DRAFT_258738 [Aspergillus bertholletiae]|uniref:Rhodopsin domain-containing protein n=1 Tax=Aspergillus bertholletiae TaxID=1226010 RepID=A0A5N7BD93_9EURO|nr:hypothetical protein BDV26DRAFT_258738 [Aspergillus bertholletiae]